MNKYIEKKGKRQLKGIKRGVNMDTKKLNLQFAGLQGTYWMTYCIVYSFASAFLLHHGFTNSEIGFTLAAANISSVIIQPIIASIVDKSKKINSRSIILSFCLFSGIIAIIILLIPRTIPVLAILFILDLIFIILIQPHLNSLPFSYINSGIPLNYGFIRAFGSFLFGSSSILLGRIIDKFTPNILLPIQLLALTIVFSITYFIKPIENSVEVEIEDSSWKDFFRAYPRFIIFILGILCMLTATNSMSTYMLQIVLSKGGTETGFGSVIGFSALVEIPSMLLFTRIISKVKVDKVLKISTVFIALRVFGIYLSTNTTQLMLAQVIQAFGYGIYTVAASYYVNLIMSDGNKVKGQTMLTMASTSGGVLGSGIGGVLIDTMGVKHMILVMVIMAGLGSFIVSLSTENIYE